MMSESTMGPDQSDQSAQAETEYLLANPANAAMLREGMREMNEGRGVVHELLPIDGDDS
jgi:hypothetical protein